MKFKSTVWCFLFTLFVFACNEQIKQPEKNPATSVGQPPPVSSGVNQEQPASASAQTVDSGSVQISQAATTKIWHYICPNKHETGSEGQGKCPVCNVELIHNDAFHTQSQSTNQATPASITPAEPPQPADPAQNARGDWHYTCPKGCAGGAGSQIACTTCGSTLQHNQKYHEQ